MVSVQMTVLEDGERVPLVFWAHPYRPALLVLLYILLRRRYLQARTLLRDAQVLGWFYAWCYGGARPRLDLEATLLGGALPTSDQIAGFSRWLRLGPRQSGAASNGVLPLPRVLAPVTLDNYLHALQAFLLWAAQRYCPQSRRAPQHTAARLVARTEVIRGIFAAVHLRGRPPLRGVGLEPAELQQLRGVVHPAHPANPFRRTLRLRNALMVEVFACTGIRRGELLKLKVEDVVADAAGQSFLVVVRRPDDPSDGRRIEPGQKTDARILAIAPPLADALRHYIRSARRPQRHGTPVKLAHAFLFVSERGAPLAESEVNQVLQRAGDRAFGAGGPRLHPHLLRHTFCGAFVDHCIEVEGLDEAAAKDRLRVLCGWSPRSDMPERYTRKRIRREANQMNLRRMAAAWQALERSPRLPAPSAPVDG